MYKYTSNKFLVNQQDADKESDFENGFKYFGFFVVVFCQFSIDRSLTKLSLKNLK